MAGTTSEETRWRPAHRYDVLHVIGTSGEEPRIWGLQRARRSRQRRAAFINSTSYIPLASMPV
jgi:hypothetical protein